MAVRRIVANLATDHADDLRAFYAEIFGLGVAMDLGFIVTLAAETASIPQLSIATSGGSGTPVPDLSIEVDDFEAVLARLTAAGLTPTYGPVREPWGVRRCYVRDPAGRLVNILTHD